MANMSAIRAHVRLAPSEALQAEATPEASAKATRSSKVRKQEKSVQRNANPGLAAWVLICRRSYRNAPRCVAFKLWACYFSSRTATIIFFGLVNSGWLLVAVVGLAFT